MKSLLGGKALQQKLGETKARRDGLLNPWGGPGEKKRGSGKKKENPLGVTARATNSTKGPGDTGSEKDQQANNKQKKRGKRRRSKGNMSASCNTQVEKQGEIHEKKNGAKKQKGAETTSQRRFRELPSPGGDGNISDRKSLQGGVLRIGIGGGRRSQADQS